MALNFPTRLKAFLFVAFLVQILGRVSAYTMEYKQKKLNSIPQSSNVLILDGLSHDAITEAPRNYSLLVLYTVLGPRFGCDVCQAFDPTYKNVAYSWKVGKGNHPLYFASIDFETSKDVFMKKKLTTAPHAYFYPANEGPYDLKLKDKEFLNYDLQQTGISGSRLVEWISSMVNEKFVYQKPPDYTKLYVSAFAILMALAFRKFIFRILVATFFTRKIWAILSLASILLFNAGFMWNQIRNPPFASHSSKGVDYINPSFQSQFGVEVQISAILHGVSALAIGGLIYFVPKLSSPYTQRLATAIFMLTFIVAYSFLFRVFLIKNRGYPFRLAF